MHDMDKPEKTGEGRAFQKSRKGIGSREWIDSAFNIERPAKGKRPF